MSLRLRLLNAALRLVARPILSKTTDAFTARARFARLARMFRMPPYMLHLIDSGPVPLHWVSVRRNRTDWVIIYLHGGAYLTGSPQTHLALVARIARMTGLQVVAPQYRLAPEHPAPAAFADAVAAHAKVIAKGYSAEQVILAGDSAGGGLAFALLADLCKRGLSPAGIFSFSPWTDLALTGGSLVRNVGTDPFVPPDRMSEVVSMVLGGLDAKDPRISPLYAEYVRPPPTLIQVGAGEMLLDDSRRMADVLRAAGSDVTLAEWPDCPHVWHMLDGYIPEARAALLDVAAFVDNLVTSWTPPQVGS